MASERQMRAGVPGAPVAVEARPEDGAALAPPRPPRERSAGLRALRWALRRSYLALLTYPGVTLINLVALVSQHGREALADGGNWLRASYLNLAVPYLFHHPAIIAPALLVAGAFVWLGWLAQQDYKRERAERKRWRQWQDQQETLRRAEAQAQDAAERAGERAVAVAETRAEEVAVVTATTTAVAVAEREVPVLLTEALDERVNALAAATAAAREAPPPSDLSALPLPDAFVGRAEELAWVKQRLSGGGTTAITALGGIGGIGKTALAAVAVRELREEGRFKDGIAVVVCANKSDARALLKETLALFNGGKEPDTDDDAALARLAARLLRGKDALVVLDNVEPALNKELARLVGPLREAGATLLLTARHDLPAAAVPPGAARRLDVLADDEARALFTRLYTAAIGRPLDAGEPEAVAEMVRTLGRHTLAVRLAALYAPIRRDLARLARELADDPLKLPDDDETPRGVALVLGRSVEALPAEAQRLFAALAAFATLDFGRNAALALAEGLGVAEPEAAVDTLARRALLDTALAAALGEGSDRERLRLHPLLRAYAAERFGQWGEAERESAERIAATYQIVASYYAQYANATTNAARAVDEANITGALEWAHKQGQEALLVRLVSGMQQYWRDRSRIRESQRYLPWAVAAAERALGAPPADADAGDAEETAAWQDRAHILFWLLLDEGYAFQVTGRLDEAVQRYDRCLALAQRAGSRRNAGAALSVLGQIAQARGRLDEAEGYLQQSLLIDREVQDRRGEGIVLGTLGQIARARGRLDEAEGYLQQSLLIDREVQDRRGEGIVLSTLGQIARARGRLDEAEGYLQQSLLIDREVQDRRGEGVILYSLALIAEAQGDLDQAEMLHRESLAIGIEVQAGQDIADSYAYLGEFLIVKRGKQGEGCWMLAEAARLYDDMGIPGAEQARETAQRLGCGEA